MQHLLSARQFSREWLDHIFGRATKYKNTGYPRQQQFDSLLLGSFFGEPSTRTRLSFESAMNRLGGRVITAADASTSSSLKKGETLADTFHTLSQYVDVLVVRHGDENWPNLVEEHASAPVINAGSGRKEHPTQAMLDLFTVWSRRGTLDGLTWMICGDLKYSRTVNSLVQALRIFDDVKIISVPASRFLGEGSESLCVVPELNNPAIDVVNFNEATDILGEVDVMYMTRPQRERHTHSAFGGDINQFVLNQDKMGKMKDDALVLHPLPRLNEIENVVDNDPRAVYLHEQIQSGVLVRAALLEELSYKGV